MNDILMTPEEAISRAADIMQPLANSQTEAALVAVRTQLALELIRAQEEAASGAINQFMIELAREQAR